MANLKTLLKRLDVVRDKIFNIAESNYQDMLDDGGFSPKSQTRAQKNRREKSKELRSEEDRLESEIKKLKKKRTFSGRGGGAMTDLSQRTGATAKGTLLKKRMY